ncbi:MAG: type 4a pilus biogenesis protein PilO [Xanthomonadales bacterium]|nr:type 4a pilus biogenesis protein PilO [Xanthomonadales bacterium]
MLNDIRDIDFEDVGSAPLPARAFLIILLAVVIVVTGYLLLIKDKQEEIRRVQGAELSLRQEFEFKQQKAANLDSYRKQLTDMEEMLKVMVRRLPGKTEMDKLLVDVSQTALGVGIKNDLFRPGAEIVHDFYAEKPITIKMRGSFHQFGDFVGSVASLPRVVILTMNDIAMKKAKGDNPDELVLEGTVKTYRYVDEDESAEIAAAQVEGGGS